MWKISSYSFDEITFLFQVISSFYRLVFARGGNEEELSTHLQGIRNGLAPFERELAQRGTTFFGGMHKKIRSRRTHRNFYLKSF